jgi:poly(A) polymerase
VETRIAPPAWLTQGAAARVLAALPGARVVGGAVRDTLAGRAVADIDIASSFTPEAASQRLREAGLKVVPTGLAHGTVTAVVQGTPVEVTTLRRDVATDGRHAVVAFDAGWREDAARRDFTINALSLEPDGTVHDFFGGAADLAAGQVRFVGEASQRIAEDYLRILRWFRFHAWYGKGDPDQAALTACKALKGMLSGRAAERTQKELLKLLAAEDPRAALRLMAATSVLSSVLPQVKALTRFETLVAIQTEQLFENDAEIRLAALLPDDAVIARDTAERLRLSNALKDRLIEAAGKEPRIVSWMSPREARRTVYKIGLRAFTDRIKLGWAASTRPSTTSQWRGLLALAETWTPPAFPLTGDEILAAGVPKGPMVGEVMREVEEWWIDNDFMDDKLAAVERLKAVTQGMCF